MKYKSTRALTPEQVRAIRAMRVIHPQRRYTGTQTGSIRHLAELFDVHDKVIIRICRRHGYKEIE